MIMPETNAQLDAEVLAYDARLGERIADAVHVFLGRFVAYPSEHARIAHTLWIMHAHLMRCWDSTPRLAFLSAEPASGKTRALEVTELLVPNPIQTVNVSPAYLFRKVGNEDGVTILFDEIDTVFGPRAKENEDIRGLLNAGHRRGATTGRCIVRGREVLTEELPAYAAVALAGIGWLPDTLLSRCIIVRMRRRRQGERVEQFRRRIHEADGWRIRDQIAAWASQFDTEMVWPDLPPQITDRNADLWEPLIAVADAVGGCWPQRARVAAVTLVTEARDVEPSLGIKLLADLNIVFADSDELSSKAILTSLHALAESPWSDIKGKPLDERGLAHRLRQYGVRSKTIRTGATLFKGYLRNDFVDVWDRYAPVPPGTSVTSVTSVTSHGGSRDGVTDVTLVTHLGDGGRVCAHCHGRDGVFCQASIAGEPVTLHVECQDDYRA
jgi:hypothetical protein